MLTNFFRQSIKNNLYKRGFVFLEKIYILQIPSLINGFVLI